MPGVHRIDGRFIRLRALRAPRATGVVSLSLSLSLSLLLSTAADPVQGADRVPPAQRTAKPADARLASAPAPAGIVARWAVATGDHGALPFLVVDKVGARLYVFDAEGQPRGDAPVLLGAARGDHTVPGIGERAISAIEPHERTTPAGRFVAERGRNTHGEDIVWIDYDAAVSMHRVRATNPAERRLERLRTPSVDDNRISYGCINVPAAFYEQRVKPALQGGKAIVYVLPETQSPHAVFGIPRERGVEESQASLSTSPLRVLPVVR